MESSQLLRKTAVWTKAYCYKIFQTACLGLAQSIVGIVMGLYGTTYLDLLLKTGSNLQTGSMIFTFAGVGSIVGSIFAGRLCDKFPREVVLALSLLGTGVCTAIVPWLPKIWFMVMSNGLAWVCLGISEAAIPLLIVGLWKSEDGPFTHAVYLCFAIGGIIGPIMSEPFLSSASHTALSGLRIRANASNSSMRFEESQIYIPYFILGFICAISAFLFLGIYIKKRLFRDGDCRTDENNVIPDSAQRDTSPKSYWKVLLCLGLFYIIYDGLENGAHSFLMAFMVEEFGWTKSSGSKALTVFWACYTAGKVLGVILSRVISPCNIMLLCLVGTNIVMILWIAIAPVYNWISWLMASLLGLFMSMVFPAGISFANAYFSGVSSNVMSWIMTCADIGNTFNPLLMGYLMQHTTPMSYLYVMIGESSCSLCLMLLIALIIKRDKVNQ